MPTLPFGRCLWIVPLIAGAVAAQAQDLHIKKSITVGGNFVSSTETSIKGARERIVSQSPTGATVTLHQCDLKRTVNINEQAQTYQIVSDAQDEAAVKAANVAAGTPDADSAGYITETSAVTDTGERKPMYGFTARHLKIKVAVQSSKNACSQLNQSYELDGWYADLSKEMSSACQQFLPPIRQNDGCSDRVIRKRSGSAKPGYPLAETISLQNADGTTTQVGVQTSELSRQPLEKELFEIPAGFREVKTTAELNGAPAPVRQAPLPSAAAPQATAPQANASMNAAAMNQMTQSPTPNARAGAMPPQMSMQQAQALAMMQGGAGMMNGGMGMAGMQGMAGTAGMAGQPSAAKSAPAPQPLGPKAPGKIRVGIAPPDAQVGQGSNAGGDYSTPIRNAVVALMSGPAVEIAPLDAHIPIQLQAEAQQKQCDFILFSGVSVKHNSGGGFGKFAKMGSVAASMTPMGMAAGSMRGAAAAQAAGMAASQMAQQQAINQLAGFNGQIKSKDDVNVQYQLVATGQTAPVLQNAMQRKAKADGEDVLTPLLQQAATEVLTQVSKK
jgi:hypothetical protein